MGSNALRKDSKIGEDMVSNALTDDQGRPASITGFKHEIRSKQVSAMQLKRYGRKGCEIFAVRIEDTREPKTTTYGDDYIYEDEEIREKFKESFEKKYPYLKTYQDVFPEELPGLPPSQAFDFTIDLILGEEAISRAPYKTTTTELMEL